MLHISLVDGPPWGVRVVEDTAAYSRQPIVSQVRAYTHTLHVMHAQFGVHTLQVSAHSGRQGLRVGDRVCAVNGVPTVSKGVQDVQRMIKCSTDVLQLTVDRYD